MRPSLKARPHKRLRFSPSEDEEAVVMKFLIEFKSASSMNSRNATRVGEVLSSGVIFVAIAVERLVFVGFDWCFDDFLAMFVRLYSFILLS